MTVKLTCHFMNRNLGLLRIDYGYAGPHTNPMVASEHVPEWLEKFAGFKVAPMTPHVHIYVQGDDLKWAVPIKDYLKVVDRQLKNLDLYKTDDDSGKSLVISNFFDVIHVSNPISS